MRRGDLDDLVGLRKAAEDADGVVHLGYNHDFTRMADAAVDRSPGRGRVRRRARGERAAAARGVRHARADAGRVATEEDVADPAAHPRAANANATQALAERGVRSIVLRLPPTVHGEGDTGFVARLVATAREKGVSGYVGDGSNRWPAVHRLDAAHLVLLALEGAAAGSAVHATAETGVAARDIAAAIGGRARAARHVRGARGRGRPLRLARPVLRRRRARLERADPRTAALAAPRTRGCWTTSRPAGTAAAPTRRRPTRTPPPTPETWRQREMSPVLTPASRGHGRGSGTSGVRVTRIQTRFLPITRSGQRAGHISEKCRPYFARCARTPGRNSLRSSTSARPAT